MRVLKKKSIASRQDYSLVASTEKGNKSNLNPSHPSLKFREILNAHRSDLFDFYMQIFGELKIAEEEFFHFSRFAAKKFRQDRFQKYSKLWLLRLAVEDIALSIGRLEKDGESKDHLPLQELDLDERLVLLLRQRMNIAKEDIAAVMQISSGAVDMRLLHAREKLAKSLMYWEGKNPFVKALQSCSLKTRITMNLAMDGEIQSTELREEDVALYNKGLAVVSKFLESLPKVEIPEIEMKRRKLFEREGHRSAFHWTPIPWHYKLLLEGMAFAFVGVLAVFCLPIIMAYYQGGTENLEKAQAMINLQKVNQQNRTVIDKRKVASKEETKMTHLVEEFDEFADMAFPSGHHYKKGAAPPTPSHNKTAIYRLTLHSANPKEIIPEIRSIFRVQQVHERDKSGSIMPGGVYFDGITTESNFNKIRDSVEKLGHTRSYFNRKRRYRKAHERARVIIWVQQI